MEHQGKTDKQVTDSERAAFWGIVGVFTIIVYLIAKSDPHHSSYPPRSLRDTTIELLKRDRDSLIHINDSLSGELFPALTELNRYQLAYKIFAKRDPEAARIFGNIMSDETE